jgi:SpoVK/Ycf46/Vps4 family AAA+-type ATPase
MNGVERREGVVVIGARNHPTRLDPALVDIPKSNVRI